MAFCFWKIGSKKWGRKALRLRGRSRIQKENQVRPPNQVGLYNNPKLEGLMATGNRRIKRGFYSTSKTVRLRDRWDAVSIPCTHTHTHTHARAQTHTHTFNRHARVSAWKNAHTPIQGRTPALSIPLTLFVIPLSLTLLHSTFTLNNQWKIGVPG